MLRVIQGSMKTDFRSSFDPSSSSGQAGSGRTGTGSTDGFRIVRLVLSLACPGRAEESNLGLRRSDILTHSQSCVRSDKVRHP